MCWCPPLPIPWSSSGAACCYGLSLCWLLCCSLAEALGPFQRLGWETDTHSLTHFLQCKVRALSEGAMKWSGPAYTLLRTSALPFCF